MHKKLKIDDYLLGIDSIDQQHAKLLEMINMLAKSMSLGDARSELESLIERLYAFAQSHFAYEEELMRQTEYPGYELHRSQHMSYQDDILKLFHRWNDGGGFMIAVDVHKMMIQWATEHILEHDKQYAEHLIKNGIS